jgi:F420-non-reducing hydrogenase iron-sulfur subunit
MFEPRIVCFFCKWCTYAGADLAGTSRKQYPPNGVVVRVNCSGRIDPQHVLWAFREGADGVLIGGCHPGDCHYQDGNYKTMRRVSFLKKMLEDMGVDPARLHLEWISAAEGDKLVHVMGDFVDTVKDLGPLELTIAGGGRGGAMRRVPKATGKTAEKKAPAAGKKPTTKAAGKKAAKPATKVAGKKATKPKKGAGKPKKKVAKRAAAKPAKKAVRKKAAKPAKTAARKKAAKPKRAAGKPKKKVAKKAAAKPKAKAARKTTRKRTR